MLSGWIDLSFKTAAEFVHGVFSFLQKLGCMAYITLYFPFSAVSCLCL